VTQQRLDSHPSLRASAVLFTPRPGHTSGRTSGARGSGRNGREERARWCVRARARARCVRVRVQCTCACVRARAFARAHTTHATAHATARTQPHHTPRHTHATWRGWPPGPEATGRPNQSASEPVSRPDLGQPPGPGPAARTWASRQAHPVSRLPWQTLITSRPLGGPCCPCPASRASCSRVSRVGGAGQPSSCRGSRQPGSSRQVVRPGPVTSPARPGNQSGPAR
jgi:hypothetical protein